MESTEDASGRLEMQFEVIIQHDELSVDPDLCRRILESVFRGEGVEVDHITLIQSDHETVRDLNRTYLEHDYDTDVLAFAYSEDDQALEGEIYIDLDTAGERHDEFSSTFEQEALRYTVHGALHLAGYRDDETAGKDKMHTMEDRYLREAGII